MNFSIENLGERKVKSPVKLSKKAGDYIADYVDDNAKTLVDSSIKNFNLYKNSTDTPPAFEVAGPRENIYFNPSEVNCAIVSCGGLCSGINDVIRSVVMELWYFYGVRNITGIKYGYRGFLPEYGYDTMELNPQVVSDINHTGGTILGSSRGAAKTKDIADTIEQKKYNIVFTIGGDGTQRGSLAIHKELKKRGLKVSIVGIPKTIDNDIMFVDKTFGYETAFSTAVESIRVAHVEAKGAFNGIGVVKLMGRDSGFVAASAALAADNVNFILVPEIPFDLEGPKGFLTQLKKRLDEKHHAVVCIAEGAGLEHIENHSTKKDASGNILHADIGVFLSNKIKSFLKSENMDFSLKYIDPSYTIRSAPAIPTDSIYCSSLGQNAVHAAMAGKTGLVVGYWNGTFTHVPIEAVVSERKKIDPDSQFWLHVIQSTSQPASLKNT